MTRSNGLDVPEAIVALLAALPFRVTARPVQPLGKGNEFLVATGPSGWMARASDGPMDRLSGTSYSETTLRAAVLAALEHRARRHESAADEFDVEARRLRLADRKRQAAERAASLRTEAAMTRKTITALAAAWPEAQS